MNYCDIIKSSPSSGEKGMWEGVKRVSQFLDELREEQPHKVKHFLKEEYIAMNGKHFNEATAHRIVSEMYHTTDGEKVIGEVVSYEDAQQLVRDKGEEWCWDAYVAANAMAHDLAGSGFNLSQIMEAAKLFFFHDEDFSDENKVFWYHERQMF